MRGGKSGRGNTTHGGNEYGDSLSLDSSRRMGLFFGKRSAGAVECMLNP